MFDQTYPACKPPSACTVVTPSLPSAATQWYHLLLLAAYGLRRTLTGQWGWLGSFCFFVPGDLDLWPLTLTFELGRDFCIMHLTAKFIVVRLIVRKLSCWQTNKHTNWQTSASARRKSRHTAPPGQSSPKWGKLIPDRNNRTSMRCFTPISFSAAEKSVTVQTNKQTNKSKLSIPTILPYSWIWWDNKQTPLKTSTSLRYATPVGNYALATLTHFNKFQSRLHYSEGLSFDTTDRLVAVSRVQISQNF